MILQVVSYLPPAYAFGGPVKVAYEVSRELTKRMHEVVVWTTDAKDFGSRLGVGSDKVVDGMRVHYFRNLALMLVKKFKLFITPQLTLHTRKAVKIFDVILEAARILREHGNVVFVVRGAGELAPWLRNRVSELDLGNVVLDTSFLPEEKLSALLRSADVFVLPMASMSFVEERLPIKVFEYQAYGKPIICCFEGEPARYVQMTNSGLVLKLGNPEAFAHAVLKLYRDRKLTWMLGWNGWKNVSENLTFNCIGKRMYNILSSVMS